MDENRKETEEDAAEKAAEFSELDELLDRAERLLEEGHFDEAVEVLRESIERFPESPLPRHDLSVVYFTRLRRKYEHLEVWEELAEDEAFFEAAVREAETALEIDGDFVPARNNLATLFALRGWWADAARHWEMSLTLQPDQSQARLDLVEARKHID